jgi:hypothetical protein
VKNNHDGQSNGNGMNRRSFVQKAGFAGAGAAAFAILGGTSSRVLARPVRTRSSFPGMLQATASSQQDTAQEIFTAALVAEDLASTMYYNALVGNVIMDPNLAGPGGSATNVTANGSLANVGYLRGAFSEEIKHADLLRELIGGTSFSGDPYQTFYFPTGTFDTLENFFSILLALEEAFIGAYLTAVAEFAQMAVRTEQGQLQYDSTGKPYSMSELIHYSKIAASIMGVESEHRALARAIPSGTTFDGVKIIPADNLNFEQTDGLVTVYNGPKSAVVALTPFLSGGTGKTAYSLATAVDNAGPLLLPTTGGIPPL